MIHDKHDIVRDLSEINYDNCTGPGRLVRKHKGAWLLHEKKAWATVLVAYQSYAPSRGWGPVEYALTRWRKYLGTWIRQKTFPLKFDHMRGLLGVVEDVLAVAPSMDLEDYDEDLRKEWEAVVASGKAPKDEKKLRRRRPHVDIRGEQLKVAKQMQKRLKKRGRG